MSNRVDNIFKLGLIDITKPSDGLIHYDIKSIESIVDEASNTVIFKVWCSYKTAVGIKVKLIPIKEYLTKPDDSNTGSGMTEEEKEELNNKLQDLSTKIVNKADKSYVDNTAKEIYNHLGVYVTRDELDNLVIPDIDLSKYATKEDLANIKIPEVDLSDYATKKDLENIAIGDIDLSSYVTKKELDNRNYVSNTELNNKDYVTNTQLVNKDYVSNTELTNKNYVNKTELENKDYVNKTYLKNQHYLTQEDIKDLPIDIDMSDYVTKVELDNKNYLTRKDLPEDIDLTKYLSKDEAKVQYSALYGSNNSYFNNVNDFTSATVKVKTPVEDNEAATKKYVDSKTNIDTGNFTKLSIDSGTVSKVILEDTSIVNKKYVDDLNTATDTGNKTYTDTEVGKVSTNLSDYKLLVEQRLNEKISRNEIHSKADLQDMFDAKSNLSYVNATFVKNTELATKIQNKAEVDNVYDKATIDDKFANINLDNVYNKGEVDIKLMDKVDVDTLQSDYTDNHDLHDMLELKADKSAMDKAVENRLADFKQLTDNIQATEQRIDANYESLTNSLSTTREEVLNRVKQAEESIATDSETLTNEINNIRDSVTTSGAEINKKIQDNVAEINAIKGKIPATVSVTNPLVDTDTMKELMVQNASNPISADVNGQPFPTYAALVAGPWYSMGQLVDAPSKNDYALVKADENHNGSSVRYNYNGAGWAFFQEFKDTNLSTAQQKAVDSGITAELVGKITTNETLIKTETNTRETERDAIKAEIGKEVTDRTAAITRLTERLATEETTRQNEDLAIKTSLQELNKSTSEERNQIKKSISDNKLDIETKVGGLEALTTDVKTSIVDAINDLNREVDDERVHKSGDIMTGTLRIHLPANGTIFDMRAGDKGLEFQMDNSKGYLHLVPASNQDLGFIYSATNFMPRQTDIPTALGHRDFRWTNAWVDNVNGIPSSSFGVRDDTALKTDDSKVWSAKRTYKEIRDNIKISSVTEDEYNVIVDGGNVEQDVVYLIRSEDNLTTEDKPEYFKSVIDTVYPVGSVYISIVDTFDPNASFGGTWEKISSGKYLKAVDIGAGIEIEAGLPDIEGQQTEMLGRYNASNTSGAFATVAKPTAPLAGSSSGAAAWGRTDNFKASRSNSIYGNSTTVTPESITVIMWKRIK